MRPDWPAAVSGPGRPWAPAAGRHRTWRWRRAGPSWAGARMATSRGSSPPCPPRVLSGLPLMGPRDPSGGGKRKQNVFQRISPRGKFAINSSQWVLTTSKPSKTSLMFIHKLLSFLTLIFMCLDDVHYIMRSGNRLLVTTKPTDQFTSVKQMSLDHPQKNTKTI